MTTPNKGLLQPAYNSTTPTWDQPLNENFGRIDTSLGSVQNISLNLAGAATVNLGNVYPIIGSYPWNPASYLALIVSVTGTLTGNCIVNIPAGVCGQWIVYNSTTGSYTLTFSSGGGGSSVVCAQGVRTIIYSDGTNVAVADDRVVPDVIPSGTAMLFIQTSAPTGWTKSTAHNNKALRVVSGTAASGGSVDFTTAFASQAVSGNVGNTTLTIDQIPSHTHTINKFTTNSQRGDSGALNSFSGSLNGTATSNAVGGGQSHTHTFTGTAINLAVSYVDAIIATKD